MNDTLTFRPARLHDLPAIIAMLVDDPLGKTRETLDHTTRADYEAGFRAIAESDLNELIVAELDGAIVGTMQLTYSPGISRQGAWRCTIEGVRTASHLRRQGYGKKIIGHAIEKARARKCRIIQLTTDVRRTDAQRFYAELGFKASHVGMKLDLA
jgi:GNAT superfamily N-acetyltransferase